jgi:hypothetical protein
MNPEDRLQALRSAPLDRWVALSEDESRVVAEGETFEEAAAKAEAQGVSDPILVKTPEDWAPRVLGTFEAKGAVSLQGLASR